MRNAARKNNILKRATIMIGRISMLCLAALVTGCATTQAMRRVEIDFSYVEQRAKSLAGKKYKEKADKAPALLAGLDYDDYRQIAFLPAETLWLDEGLPFQVQFFHLGYLYTDKVRMHEFTSTHEQRIPYVDSFFSFGDLELKDALSKSLGYAGFKILYPLNNEELPYDELLSFVGSSYFRALGEGMRYGLSARGLAVNSGLSSEEEFPRFTQFWLGKPIGNSSSMTLYALLEGPSVTGAYKFIVQPGETTRIDVKSTLFFRADVESLGLAPLTSMFWYGENSVTKGVDYRPEVHDSDGLLLETDAGERLWRPLNVGERTQLSFFRLDSPRGFGLFQRDRSFENYQDLEAAYEARPSLWIRPKSDWGDGHVKLVELPHNKEFDDNIVAFWEPAKLPQKGQSLTFEYAMFWTGHEAEFAYQIPSPVSTRVGDHSWEEDTSVFVIDFKPGDGSRFDPAVEPEVVASLSGNAKLTHVWHQWNPHASAWRAILQVRPSPGDSGPVELLCRLDFESGLTSETWTYQWKP